MRIIHYINFKENKFAYWEIPEDDLFQAEIHVTKYELEQSRLTENEIFEIRLEHILKESGKLGLRYFHFREREPEGMLGTKARRFYFTMNGTSSYKVRGMTAEEKARFKSKEFQELFQNLITN